MAKTKTDHVRSLTIMSDGPSYDAIEPPSRDTAELLNIPFIVPDTLEKSPEQMKAEEDWRRTLVTLGEGKAVSFKDSVTMMSHPLFGFRPKKESLPRVIDCEHYTVTLSPSNYGLPTYNDADILIYAMSMIAARIKKTGQEVTAELLRFHSDIVFSIKDYYKSIGKTYGGKQQQAFLNALQRLSTTSITITADREVNGRRIRFEQTATGFLENTMSLSTLNEQINPMAMIRLRLADWIIRDVITLNVLTIPVEYFDMSPFAKSLYLIARRHLGTQKTDLRFSDLTFDEYVVPVEQVKLTNGHKMDRFYWTVSLSNLARMTGNSRQIRNFKQDLIKAIAEVDFGFFEIAITDTRRLKDTEVVFFKKLDLAHNIAKASLFYAGFREFYEGLLTAEKIKQKLANNDDL